jgi:hypothetical protein
VLNNVSSFRLCLVAASICALWLAGLCSESQAVPRRQLKRNLSETMAKIRDEKTINSRTEAAEHLAMLTRGINPRKVDDATLTEMISLLDTDEDSVRFWVAAALGHLGPRAKQAVPRLLKLLHEVDCLPGSLTSAPAIRVALKRMGQRPPPEPNCSPEQSAPQIEDSVTLTLGMRHELALQIIRACGGQDITSGQAVVGPNGEWPLNGIFWNLEQYDSVLEIAVQDGNLVGIGYWTVADFSESKIHRVRSRKSLKSLTFEKQAKRVKTQLL